MTHMIYGDPPEPEQPDELFGDAMNDMTDSEWLEAVTGLGVDDFDEMHAIAEQGINRVRTMRAEIEQLQKENGRLDARLNSPEIHDFADAVVREAAHQRERWGSEHDEGKSAIDWVWLVAFLVTKASQAERYGDQEKYLHHIITAAAACCNWHASAAGTNTEMRAGPKQLESTKDNEFSARESGPDAGLSAPERPAGDATARTAGRDDSVPEQGRCQHRNRIGDGINTEKCADCGEYLTEKNNE